MHTRVCLIYKVIFVIEHFFALLLFTLFIGSEKYFSALPQKFTAQIINNFRHFMSGGELLELWLLDTHLLDTFGRKSTARQKIYQLLESS